VISDDEVGRAWEPRIFIPIDGIEPRDDILAVVEDTLRHRRPPDRHSLVGLWS